MESSEGGKQKVHCKIVVVGNAACGKTCILQRYVHNMYNDKYKTTIGVDFLTKEVTLPSHPNTVAVLQLWDIAAQERFGHMTPVCFSSLKMDNV